MRLMDFANIPLWSMRISKNIYGDVKRGIAGEAIESEGGYKYTFKTTNEIETQFVPRLAEFKTSIQEGNILELPETYALRAYAESSSVTLNFFIVEKKPFIVLESNDEGVELKHMFPLSSWAALVYLPMSIKIGALTNNNIVIDPIVYNDGLSIEFESNCSIARIEEMVDWVQPMALVGIEAPIRQYVNYYEDEIKRKKEKQQNDILEDLKEKECYPIAFFWKHFNMSCNHFINDYRKPMFKFQ